jgi:hypothetical protein
MPANYLHGQREQVQQIAEVMDPGRNETVFVNAPEPPLRRPERHPRQRGEPRGAVFELTRKTASIAADATYTSRGQG